MSNFTDNSDIFNKKNPEENLKMSVPTSPEMFKLANEFPVSNHHKRHNPKIELLKESPESIAEQLTQLCSEIFSQIQPEEFEKCAFEKKDKSSRTPYIYKFQDFFNRTSAWVTKSILDLSLTEKQRAEMITHFIKVAKKLFEHKNFHCLMAVVVSLERKAIYRLKRTWKRVECKKTLDNLSEIITYDNNYEKLWAVLTKSDVPCIPYLGLYTKRLVELDAAANLVTEGPDPREVSAKLITDIQYYQHSQSVYSLREIPHVKCLLEKELRDCYLDELERFFEAGITKISSGDRARGVARVPDAQVHFLQPHLPRLLPQAGSHHATRQAPATDRGFESDVRPQESVPPGVPGHRTVGDRSHYLQPPECVHLHSAHRFRPSARQVRTPESEELRRFDQ